jgi:putative ABC transport system substrate-binding protein
VKRRVLIGALGGALGGAVRAQVPASALPVIGFFSSNSAATTAHLVEAFRRGLAEAGYGEGRNVVVEYRWSDGQSDLLPAIASDFARRPVAVIVVFGTTAVAAARDATTTVPVVFATGSDPVATGLVASLNRPGGNRTGIAVFTSTIMPKRLELLHEAVPAARRVALIGNPTGASAAQQQRDVEQAARGFGVAIESVPVSSASELAAAFAGLRARGVDAVLFGADLLFQTLRDRAVALAAEHGLPAMYEYSEFAEAGGLISFGPDRGEAFRLQGVYAGRVLAGARPADLPVIQSTRFELVVNVGTARRLGLALPQGLLARADQVIE